MQNGGTAPGGAGWRHVISCVLITHSLAARELATRWIEPLVMAGFTLPDRSGGWCLGGHDVESAAPARRPQSNQRERGLRVPPFTADANG